MRVRGEATSTARTGGSARNIGVTESVRITAMSGTRCWNSLPGMTSVLESLHRRAGADQVAVSVGLVNAAHRGPVLAPVVAGQRVGALLPRVRVLPVSGEQHRRGVRRVGQRVVLAVVVTAGDPGDLLPDRDHRTAEPVDLG